MKMTPLKQWAFDEGYYVRKDGRQPTHLLMERGKLAIPQDKMTLFYKKYAMDVISGHRNYVVEQRTKCFPFLIDVDMYEDEPLSIAKIQEYVVMVQGVVSEFFAEAPLDCKTVIVCGCASDGRRNGLHLTFPELTVTAETALVLRDAIVMKAIACYGIRAPPNTWGDVFDQSVYKGNGLRMPGSYKMIKCTSCPDGGECSSCSGTKLVDVGRVYWPIMVLKGDGSPDAEELQLLKDDIFKLVVRTTLRTTMTVPKYKYQLPDWFKYEGHERGTSLKRWHSAMRQNKESLEKNAVQKLEGAEDAKMRRLEDTDKRTKAISYFIYRQFPKNPQITAVFISSNENYYCARSSSRYCQNKGENHQNNSVYFHIDRRGVRQKCFCVCSVERKFGFCRDFCSAPVSLSSQARNKLFPRKAEKMNSGASGRRINPMVAYTDEDEEFVLNFIKNLI